MLTVTWFCIRLLCLVTCIGAIWLGLSLKEDDHHLEEAIADWVLEMINARLISLERLHRCDGPQVARKRAGPPDWSLTK